MSKDHRKLRVLLNAEHPRSSRVVDAETGADILATNIQIDLGWKSGIYETALHLTVIHPGFEIMVDEPLAVPEQPQ